MPHFLLRGNYYYKSHLIEKQQCIQPHLYLRVLSPVQTTTLVGRWLAPDLSHVILIVKIMNFCGRCSGH